MKTSHHKGNSQAVKAVFMGSDPIAIPFLDAWVSSHTATAGISAVITQPDRASGRGHRLQANPIKRWAESHEIPVYQPEKADLSTVELFRSRAWDLAIVMAYGRILPKSLLDTPRLGCFNLHASALPSLRGASPIETAIACGFSKTAVCLMAMSLRLDAGPILDTEPVPISDHDSGPSLRTKIAEACIPLLMRNLPPICTGTPVTYPQDESRANYCRLITKSDALLDLSLPAKDILNHIRAFQSWPGSAIQIGDLRLKLGTAILSDSSVLPNSQPGSFTTSSGRLFIQTGSGVIEARELQKPGGKMLKTDEFLRGSSLPECGIINFTSAYPLIADKPFRRPSETR